jgi:hypothetical protein
MQAKVEGSYKFVTVLDTGVWTASRPSCFVSGKIIPDVHWVSRRIGLDSLEKGKNSYICRE